MRTVIDLPDEQIKALKILSDVEHLSRAELVRRAVADFLVNKSKITQDEAFGLWKNNPKDGLAFQQNAREEWDD